MGQQQHGSDTAGNGRRQLEICAETLQACSAAEAGGADRIELCAALSEGGVSPSRGLLAEALRAVRIPIHAMVRPRTGNFVYSEAEFSAMLRDAEDALALGAAGIVTGLLMPGRIDEDRMRTLLRVCGERPVTFHRAFDQVENLSDALETLIAAGCDRVLCSGGAPTVEAGFLRLRELATQAAGRIRIAAGGGVTAGNVGRLATIRGLDVHASLRLQATDKAAERNVAKWQGEGPCYLSADAVRRLREALDQTDQTDQPQPDGLAEPAVTAVLAT